MSITVGKSVARVDAFDKVTGRTKYYEDRMPAGALYIRIKHAEIAHGFVKSVDTAAAEAIDGVVKVLTCFDVPDIPFPTAGHPWSMDPGHQDVADRHLLNRHVRYYGDDVAVVIAENEVAAMQGVRALKVEYEELPFVLDVQKAMEPDGTLRIGSLTSFSHITRDPLVQKYINVLGEAVDQVGGPQIRNIGTIGGNTCNGVTSADSASTLHAWDAVIELTGKNGARRLPIRDFYIKAGKVDIRAEDGEIQTAVLIPKESYENCFGHYIKYAMRNAMDIATLGTSVNVRLSADKKTVERARVAFGVAGPVPLRAATAEAMAKGQIVSLELAERFAQAVTADINPRDSWRAAKDFRLHIAVESAKRAFIESVKLAGGEL